MTIVIDASVALKWVLEEEGSDQARAVAASEIMVAPDLWLIECSNVLTTKVRRGQITAVGSSQALDVLVSAPVRIMPTRGLIGLAHGLALELNKSAYDCLYLAVAVSERATMVTADAAFFRAASAVATYAPHIRML
ncbi:MAG: type II toxin-antitoxin system VapC family toxin [Caulobacter sp.]|nr:type II toxin-antitoxin system VapC family toxin [Caulobacter sp.]